MENYAEATCVLEVNMNCKACKLGIVEVLGSICGEYSFEIDTEKGEVKIFAFVDPNLLVKALSRTGYHAKLKLARIQHLKVNRNYGGVADSYGCYSHGGRGPFNNYPSYGGGGAIDYYPHQHQGHGQGYYPPRLLLPPPHPQSPYPPPHAHPYSQVPDPNPYNHVPGRWANGPMMQQPFGFGAY